MDTSPEGAEGHVEPESGRVELEPNHPAAAFPNVDGRQVVDASDGFGQEWEKVYTVRLGPGLSPETVIETWRNNFDHFWPPGNRLFQPHRRLEEGDIAGADLGMPGGVKLSTGLVVVDSTPTSFTFATLLGHMLCGQIAFSSYVLDGETVAQARTVMRASDPLYELGLMYGGHTIEDRFWKHTLSSLANHLGVEQARVRRRRRLLDRRRQWKRWRNAWYNAAIRTQFQRVASKRRPEPDPSVAASSGDHLRG